jgi:hypothetical protein
MNRLLFVTSLATSLLLAILVARILVNLTGI